MVIEFDFQEREIKTFFFFNIGIQFDLFGTLAPYVQSDRSGRQ